MAKAVKVGSAPEADYSFEQRMAELNQNSNRRAEEEHKSQYHSWIQSNRDYSVEISLFGYKYPLAMAIFNIMCAYMNPYNEVVIAIKDLAKIFNVDKRTVYRAIKVLSDHNYIWSYKNGVNNVYVISPKLCWTSWGSNMKYCKFPPYLLPVCDMQSSSDIFLDVTRKKDMPCKVSVIKCNREGGEDHEK